jgi:hypothetical protein
MQRPLKHRLLVGAVALVLAGSAGGAYAATQSGTDSRQALISDVAKRLGVTPSQLQSAIQGALLDRLQAAVKAGKITQAEADRLKQRIQQGELPFGGFWRHGRDLGRGDGLTAPEGPRHGFLSAAATYLGVSESQLLSDLQGGKTLAQVAQAQGKSVSWLDQTLVAAAKAHLDRLVSRGWMTKADEQQRLSGLSGRIDQLVHHAPDMPPAGASPGDAQGPPAPGPGPFGSPPPGA